MKSKFKQWLKPTMLWAVVMIIILFVGILIWTFSTSSFFLIGGGSTSVRPILDDFTNYYQRNPKGGTRVLYNSIGSAAAFTGVKNKSYSFGFLSETVQDAQAISLWNNEHVVRFAIARDFFVIIYHLPNGTTLNKANKKYVFENKIDGTHLNFQDFDNNPGQDEDGSKLLQKLYKDKDTWNAVFPGAFTAGQGNVKPIIATREDGSGTRSFFESTVLKTKDYEPDIVASSNGEMLQQINNTPNSIGYLSYGYISQIISSGGADSDTTIGAVTVKGKATLPYDYLPQTNKNYTFSKTYDLTRPFTGIVNIDAPNLESILRFLAWIIDPIQAASANPKKNTAAYWMRLQGEQPIEYSDSPSSWWMMFNDNNDVLGPNIPSLYKLIWDHDIYRGDKIPGIPKGTVYPDPYNNKPGGF